MSRWLIYFSLSLILLSCRFDTRLPARKPVAGAPTPSSTPVQGTAVLSVSDGPTFGFGTVIVGNSNDKIFTITNSGDGAATSVSGSFTGAHFILKGGTFPGTGGTCTSGLNAGSSCTIVGQFAPQSTGAKSDTLSIAYGSGVTSTSATRAVSGTGQTPAALTISDAGYSYGNVSTTGDADKIFTVTNTGEATATGIIDNAFVPGTDYDFAGGTYPGATADCGGSLAGNNTTCTLNVRFTPSGLGVKNDAISLSYSTGVITTTVTRTITGTGIVYGPAGALDTSFNTDGKFNLDISGSGDDTANTITTQTDGKLIVGGTTLAGGAAKLVRFAMEGVLDTSYSTDGIFGGGNQMEVHDVAITTEGKSVAAVAAQVAFTTSTNFIYRVNANGNLDTSFMTGGIATVSSFMDLLGAAVAIQTDGKYVSSAYVSTVTGPMQVNRLLLDGNLDTSFDTDGTSSFLCAAGSGTGAGKAGKVKMFADGRIAVVGWGDGTPQTCLAKLNTDGTYDTSFHSDGVLVSTSSRYSFSLAIDTSGRVYTIGETPTDGMVMRFDLQGNLDTTFSTDGMRNVVGGAGITSFKDGFMQGSKLVVSGSVGADGALIGRLGSDGSLDTSFFTDGTNITAFLGAVHSDVAFGVTQRIPDNQICAAGYDPAEKETQIFCVTP